MQFEHAYLYNLLCTWNVNRERNVATMQDHNTVAATLRRLLRIPLTGHETDWITSDQCCTRKFASFTWPLSIPIVSPEGMLMTIAASKWCGSSLSFAVFLVHAIIICLLGALTRPEVVTTGSCTTGSCTTGSCTTGSCTTGSCYDRKLLRPKVAALPCGLSGIGGLDYWTGILDRNAGMV